MPVGFMLVRTLNVWDGNLFPVSDSYLSFKSPRSSSSMTLPFATHPTLASGQVSCHASTCLRLMVPLFCQFLMVGFLPLFLSPGIGGAAGNTPVPRLIHGKARPKKVHAAPASTPSLAPPPPRGG